MRVSAVCLISEIIERLEERAADRGRPRLPVEDVVATLQFFLREGVQWRALPASRGRASGSTVRRRLRDWHDTALLTRVHAVLLRMVRCDLKTAAREWDVIVDSCSVRARHGGDLTGPNPTDRGKRGAKYHLVVTDDGLPLGAVTSAANVHDTRMFPELLRLALVAGIRIARLLADVGYDSADNRCFCLREGIQPRIRKIGSDHGSGLGVRRSKVENANAWILNNKRLDRRHDRLADAIA